MSQAMIDQRLQLHELLCNIEGVKKVYYQPPSSEKLWYPCIIYKCDSFDTMYANNKRYLAFPRYTLTLIDYDVESELVERVLSLSDGCHVSLDQTYSSDGLFHWAFTLYLTKGQWQIGY